MPRAVLLVFSLIMLYGCAGIAAPDNVARGNNTQNSEPAHYPLPSTANLTFTRNASDVLNTETRLPEPPHFDFSNATTENGTLIVRYFYSPGCSACKALRPEIDRLEGRYQGLDWREYDITTQNGTLAYGAFADQYNLTSAQRLVPQVLVNGTVITDRFNINRSLEGIVSGFLAP